MDIKSVIQRHGKQIQEVAQQMGMKQSSLSGMISGNPTVNSLRLIAEKTGCHVIEFFLDELPADFDFSQFSAPKQPEIEVTADTEEHQESAPGVFVCPHCGAGVSFNSFVVKEPKEE